MLNTTFENLAYRTHLQQGSTSILNGLDLWPRRKTIHKNNLTFFIYCDCGTQHYTSSYGCAWLCAGQSTRYQLLLRRCVAGCWDPEASRERLRERETGLCWSNDFSANTATSNHAPSPAGESRLQTWERREAMGSAISMFNVTPRNRTESA